jgi:hypothetical protein
MVMKYLSDEELAGQQGIDPATGKPLSSAPGGSLTPGGSTVPVQKPQGEQQTGGSGFTSITQYLEQNKPQAEKLAGQVGSYVTGKGETARNLITEGENKFKREILMFCHNKKHLSYCELEVQVKNDCLRVDSYNGTILGKWYKKDLIR